MDDGGGAIISWQVSPYAYSTYEFFMPFISYVSQNFFPGVVSCLDPDGILLLPQALSTLRQLGLRPKRTLRVVLWTCEEFGGVGSHQYYLQHRHEADNMTLVMESDMGVFRPNGLTFTGPEAATAVMKDVVSLLSPINATSLSGGGYETDTAPWQQEGVPGASLASDNARYFWYHHSQGDQMQVRGSTREAWQSTWMDLYAHVLLRRHDVYPMAGVESR